MHRRLPRPVWGLPLLLLNLFGCSATGPSPSSDRAMVHRIEQAFDLEKQRRATVPQPGYMPKNPGLDTIAGLRATVSSERERRAQVEAEMNRLQAQQAEQRRVNAEVLNLRAELAGEQKRNEALREELEKSRSARAQEPSSDDFEKLQAQLDEERERRVSAERKLEALTASSKSETSTEGDAELTRLRRALERERDRRIEVEQAWGKLRQETSIPALAPPTDNDVELLALKQELQATKNALAAERKARESAESQEPAAAAPPPPPPPPPAVVAETATTVKENRRLRQQIIGLQQERDALRLQLKAVAPARGSASPSNDGDVDDEF